MKGKSRQIQEWRPGDPTPLDIRRQCEQIQAGWTDSERSKRSRMMPGAPSSHRDLWEVPLVKTAEVLQRQQSAS
jgi:hypothetical protein